MYATSSRLERDGMVETVETVREGGPDRTVYAITEAGRRHLDAWLRDTEQPGPYVADELVRKTVTALHSGGDPAGFLRRQRAVDMAALRALTARRERAGSTGALIALDHTVAHLDADLRWLEDARARVERATDRSTP